MDTRWIWLAGAFAGFPSGSLLAEEGKASEVAAPTIARDGRGEVTIAGPAGLEIRYWVTGPHATPSSARYRGPFPLPGGGTVKALAVPPDGSPLVISAKSLAAADFPPLGIVPPAAPPAGEPKRDAGWSDVKPERFEPAKRLNDDFPLSDQGDTGGWVKYPPMTDEFDGDKLDETKWWPVNPSWKGRQPGLFQKENIAISGAQMHIAMRREAVPEAEKAHGYRDYTCAAVQSRTRARYGYFECRARAMRSAGSSAFWLYDGTAPWWTEIDIFEIGGRAPGKERNLFITLHFFRSPVEDRHWQVGSFFLAPEDLADGYHVYGMDWDEKELKFYFDGVLVRRGPNTHWHQPLTLNFDSETMPEWFGLPKDADLPSTFSVDYVRVWKKKG